jgi:Rho family protein
MLAAKFRSSFRENEVKVIELDNTYRLDSFMPFLEYLYTDHSPIEANDSMGILILADKFQVPRLITLCELYISKDVEKATADSILKANIDVVEVLLFAQARNAHQLAKFCLHWLSTNYQAVTQRKDWMKKLEGENLEYVETNQWPPKSYLKELEEYEQEMKGEKGEKCILM